MPATSPAVIYRYQPLRRDALDLVRNGRLWFSDPSRFNDPFDFVPDFSGRMKSFFDKDREKTYWCDSSIRGSRIEFLRQTEDRRNRIIREQCQKERITFLEDLAKTFLVACFSETPDSILMWSHYADYHRGLCIGIRPEKMRLPPQKALRWKVSYNNKRLPENHRKPNEIPLRKAKAWKYEKEWRVVMAVADLKLGKRPFPREHPQYPSKPGHFLKLEWDALESVRFGALVNPKKRSQVLKALQRAEQRHINIFQMHLAADRFELEEERLS